MTRTLSTKIRAERRAINNRLVYFLVDAGVEFWDQHWELNINAETYKKAELGWLGEFEEPFIRHLPQKGRIVEAGCGPGTIVLALRKRGYDCVGVEWSVATVRAARNVKPELPLIAGDVTKLDVPNSYYAGYISLGVVEHVEEGPTRYLKEAFRVLEQDGKLLLSVPHYHWLRRLKATLGLYRSGISELPFYQYAYSKDEMNEILQCAGFTIIDTYTYSALKGVKEEVPIIDWLSQWRFFRGAFRLTLARLPFISRDLGHMILFVCQKGSTTPS